MQGDAVELYRPFTAVALVQNGGRRWEPPALAARVPELFAISGIMPEPSNPMSAGRFKLI